MLGRELAPVHRLVYYGGNYEPGEGDCGGEEGEEGESVVLAFDETVFGEVGGVRKKIDGAGDYDEPEVERSHQTVEEKTLM